MFSVKFCSHRFSRLENVDMSASSIEKCFIDKIRTILISSRRCQLELVKVCTQYDRNFYIRRNIQHTFQARHKQTRQNMEKNNFYVNNGWIFHEVLMCHKQKDHQDRRTSLHFRTQERCHWSYSNTRTEMCRRVRGGSVPSPPLHFCESFPPSQV